MSRQILAAVAWPYANGPRHIGHVAGFGVPSDVFSRYHRLAGNRVLMVSGTDEHGTPILVQADQEGVTPRELADRYNRVIAEDLQQLGLSYDLFTRTTTRNHYAVVQEMFKTLHRNGYMIERTTKGAISPSTGRTLPDRYIEGTCPICGYDGARGDQCDNCGNQLDAEALINPHSRINGEVPVFVETEQFFLDLPALADALGSWLQTRKDWRPNVLKFSLNLIDDLKPRAMSRDIDWGVPIPLPGWEDNPTKRLYVWFDAVIGYLSASIEWARRSGDPDAWRAWWTDASAESYYFMGKDNVTFHSQIWPAELLGYDGKGSKGGSPGEFGELQLPTEVVSSEFLTMEGRKFSSSRNVVIYVRDFLSRYSADSLRYYLTAAGPETNDTDFTWSEFVRRNNDELVAAWGNLVNRTLSFTAKNLGSLPAAGELTDVDRALLASTDGAFAAVGADIERSRMRAALSETMRVVSEANKYLSEEAPWKLRESEPERMATILHVALQAVSDCTTMLAPFLPHTSQQVHELLGREGVLAPQPELREVDDLDGGPSYPVLTGDYDTGIRWQRDPLNVGTPVAAPTPLFAKLDDSVVEEELARMADEWTTSASGRERKPGRDGEAPPPPPPLTAPAIDSHCHLDLMDVGVDEAMAAARAIGVERVVQIGIDVPSSRWSAELAASRDDVWAAVAVHPNEAHAATDAEWDEIARLAAQPRIVAVGETGLDHYRTEDTGWAAQEESFRRHIAIAKQTGKAVMIHDRDAHDDVLRVLESEGAPDRVIFHCFSGDADFARRCADRGYVMSFAGNVTFKNAQDLRDAAAVAPLDQMLVETDAPFLTPMPHRGAPNAPYLIPLTVRAIAAAKGIDEAEVSAAVTATAARVFGWA